MFIHTKQLQSELEFREMAELPSVSYTNWKTYLISFTNLMGAALKKTIKVYKL